MSKRDEQWAKYEELAHKIVDELMPYAIVTLDDHVRGVESETQRQIDVSAKWSDQSGDYLLIVQARDRKRPADVNTIGEFRSVIQDVGASKGILMCSGGFSKSAKTYARNCGILLYSLHDASSRHWAQELTVPLVWVNLIPEIFMNAPMRCEAGDSIQPDPNTGFIPLSSDGGRTIVNIMSTFKKAWNEGSLDRTVGGTYSIPGPPGPLKACVLDREEKPAWRPVQDCVIWYRVKQEAWLGQYRPMDCRGLIDFLDGGKFIPSYVNLSDIPTTRDDSWVKISDPNHVAVKTRGLVITSEGFEVAGEGKITHFGMHYIGP